MHLHLEARGSLDTIAFAVLYILGRLFGPSHGNKVNQYEKEVQH